MPGWNLIDSEGAYDPDARYTQASDRKGHAAWLRVRVPVNIASGISRIVQSGIIEEYSTSQALVRDAIVHHLHKLSKQIKSGELERTLSLATLYDAAQKRRADREMFDDMMAIVETECQHMLLAGQHDQLRVYLNGLLDNAHAVPAIAREEYIGMLEVKLKLTNG